MTHCIVLYCTLSCCIAVVLPPEVFPWSLLSSAEWWQKQPICLNRCGPVRCGGPDQPKNPLLSRTAPCCTNNAMHCHGRKKKLLDCPSSRVAGGKAGFLLCFGSSLLSPPVFFLFPLSKLSRASAMVVVVVVAMVVDAPQVLCYRQRSFVCCCCVDGWVEP